jgi:uncharacterized membrane protein
MKLLLRYFVNGALVVTPFAITGYLVWQVVAVLDGIIPLKIPGLGLLLGLLLVVFVGFLASNVLGKALVAAAEGLFTRLPLVKLIYTSLKDLILAFVGDKKRFDRPAAVEFPGAGHALGFVTRDTFEFPGFEGSVAVYFPQSYNFAGNVLIVPRDRVRLLNADSSAVMTFVVSGGVSGGEART